MNFDPASKVVLITGGAKRVGAAITRALHREGASILLHYHTSASEACALQAELNQVRAGSVVIAQANLLDSAALQPLVDTALQQFGRLDALVNNASSYYPTQLGQINTAQWEELMGSNLKAPAPNPKTEADKGRKASFCARMGGGGES